MSLENGTATDRSATLGGPGPDGIDPAVYCSLDMTAGPPDWETAKRIHYLIHRGCVEIRLLAGDVDDHRQQIFDLSDLLEILPSFLERWHELSVKMVRSMFRDYESKYPDSKGRFTPFLDEYPIHRWF
jgi:hypothetical protein